MSPAVILSNLLLCALVAIDYQGRDYRPQSAIPRYQQILSGALTPWTKHQRPQDQPLPLRRLLQIVRVATDAQARRAPDHCHGHRIG